MDNTRAKQMAAARAAAAEAAAKFSDDPARLSGWGHNFVCPDCAARVTFDIDMVWNPPHVFVCPNCGGTASSVDHDEAWVGMYRQHYAEKMEAVAAAALDGDTSARDFMARYIDFYADNYEKFPVHGRWAGKGKVEPQSLDEGVWAIAILRGLYPARRLFTAAQLEKWYRLLFKPLAELLLPQSMHVHNIPCWLRCAIGMIGITFGDDTLLTAALEGDFGIRRQVAAGFTADGLWYEGSLHYHYYTAEGLTYFLALYADKNPDDPLISRLADIYNAPLMLSHDGWHLQSTNDGWYPRTLETYATQIHRAAVLTGDPGLLRQVDKIRELAPESIALPYALLIEKPRESCKLWTATNLAIFDAPMKFILKSGVISPSHRHRDSLSVILPPYSDDLGTPGYGHPLTPGWYRLAASHNCVTVDLEQAGDIYKTHIEAVPGGARAVYDSGWEGVESASRTVTQEGDALIDVTEISCSGTHTIDWLLHLSGDVSYHGEASPAAALGDAHGYEHLTHVRKVTADGDFVIRAGALTVKIAAAGDVYLADSPDNPADGKRTAVIVRTVGNAAAVRAEYTTAE